MSNAIKRCFINLLSQDTKANDLTGVALDNKKQEILDKYQMLYNLDPLLFTNTYWKNCTFHYKSLQTLLGDSTNDWFKQKIIPFQSQIEPNDLPIIQIQCNEDVQNYGEIFSWQGLLTFNIIAKSSENMAIAENIGWRLINLLKQNHQLPQSITVPNNILGLTYSLSSSGSNQGDEYDTISHSYKIITQFIEV